MDSCQSYPEAAPTSRGKPSHEVNGKSRIIRLDSCVTGRNLIVHSFPLRNHAPNLRAGTKIATRDRNPRSETWTPPYHLFQTDRTR